MASLPGSTLQGRPLQEPRDPDLIALHRLWLAKRGARRMPSRPDFDPAEFRNLLPEIVLYDIGPAPGSYTVRLIGERLVQFAGRNVTGKPAGAAFGPEGEATLTRILDNVVSRAVPVFGAGQVYWAPDKSHKHYEVCLLPLSADGETVNMILGALKIAGL
jgi:hypothetical protein